MDFNTPGLGKILGETIKAEINAYSATTNTQRYATRLSPSSIGDECVAKGWYAWRWAKMGNPVDGRMARYLKRGEEEEIKIVTLLRATGWTVEDIDPATNDQWAVTDFNGHYYGKLDGIASHPVHTQGVKILFENKFINYKRYSTFYTKPLVEADPKYYEQICSYMMMRELPACMFVTGNRNDDDLNFQIIPRNDSYAREVMNKAHTIATSKVRPARIAESPAFYKCKTCEFNQVCHEDAPVDISCRSCIHCVPQSDPAFAGKFYCEKWNLNIPGKNEILQACPSHEPIK